MTLDSSDDRVLHETQVVGEFHTKLQAEMDERGYICMYWDKPLKVGDSVTIWDAEEEEHANVHIIGEATKEEFDETELRFYGICSHSDFPYYYKAIAD